MPTGFLKNPLNHFIKSLQDADAQGMNVYINKVSAIVNEKVINEI